MNTLNKMKNNLIHQIILLGVLALSAVSLPGLHAASAPEDLSVAEITELLALPEEKIASLKSVFTDYQTKREEIEKRIPTADTPVLRKALVSDSEALTRRFHADLQAIVSKEEMEKLQSHLKEVKAKPGAGADREESKELLKELKLSSEQGIRMKAVLSVYQPQIQTLMNQLKNADGFRSKRKISQPLKELRDEMNAGVRSILTVEQYDQWMKHMDENKKSMREKLQG
jgi:hypothetical protein